MADIGAQLDRSALALNAPTGLNQDAVEYYKSLLNHAEYPYFTGAQTQVFIGATFLVNAIDVTWNESVQNEPYWGYRSSKFDHVFDGKTLVQGQLILNLFDNHLLDIVCDRAYPIGVSPESQIARVRSDPRLAEEFIDRAVASAAKENVASVATAMDSMSTELLAFTHADELPQGAGVPQRLAIATKRWLRDQQRYGIDIHTHFGDPTEIAKPWSQRRSSLGETIKSVVFTGESRRIMVSADVLAQAYPFFAREIDRGQ